MSGCGAEAGVKGGQVVVGTGRLRLGRDSNSGWGVRTSKEGGGDGWDGDVLNW